VIFILTNSKIEVSKSIIDQTGAQSVSMKANMPIKEEITPVLELHKFSNILKQTSNSATANITVYTTPSDKDFYLTSASIEITKNAACDNTEGRLLVWVDNENLSVLKVLSQTLTAGSDHNNIVFPYPLKIDRGRSIQMVGAFGAGALTKSCTITGFTL